MAVATWLLLSFAALGRYAAAAPPPAPPGYELIPELSDEFDGDSLDTTKWSTSAKVISWAGRAPGLFDPDNVKVADGKLQLWARAATRNASWPAGFDNYTTAAVRSLHSVRGGYFEIRWRSGSSGISSSWWFHTNNGSNTNPTTAWTEIDVFETTGTDNVIGQRPASEPLEEWCGTTPLRKCRSGCPPDPEGTCGPNKQPFKPGQPSCNMCPCNHLNTSCASGGASAKTLPSHVHVFKLPHTDVTDLPATCNCTEGKPGSAPCSKPATYDASVPFSAQFQTASMKWSAETGTIEIALNGTVVNTIVSPCLVEEIAMDFDRETMPGWMALPDPATLPDAPFEVDYVRSWRKVEVAQTDKGR
jgi:hypothetical protein